MATEGFHEYDVSRFWVYELLARYRVEGEAAFISCSQTTSHHTDRHACRSRWADWPRSSTRPHHHHTGHSVRQTRPVTYSCSSPKERGAWPT